MLIWHTADHCSFLASAETIENNQYYLASFAVVEVRITYYNQTGQYKQYVTKRFDTLLHKENRQNSAFETKTNKSLRNVRVPAFIMYSRKLRHMLFLRVISHGYY